MLSDSIYSLSLRAYQRGIQTGVSDKHAIVYTYLPASISPR